MRPADTIYNAVSQQDDVNPVIIYNCKDQHFGVNLGKAMNGIAKSNNDTAHLTFRFDGGKHFSTDLNNIKGINPATEKLGQPPKGVPDSYPLRTLKNLEEANEKNPYRPLYTARTIELSMVDNPEDVELGVYARWNLPMPLKEMKTGGDLDRACKALLGADYITVGMADQKVKAEKKAEEQKAKQEEAEKKKSEAKAGGTAENKQ